MRSNVKNSLILLGAAAFLLLSAFLLLACMQTGAVAGSDSGDVTNARPAGEITVPHDVSVLFINAGRADSILLSVDGRHYLIDTGEDTSVPAIKRALELRGVDALDGVFLTHSHSDHIGGLRELAETYDIAQVYAGEITLLSKKGKNKLDNAIEKAGLTEISTKLSAGDTVALADGVSFEVIGPLELNTDDDNDNSLILRLEVNGRVLLFTGDMQFAEEQTLLDAGVDVRADVLKVGNHGNPDATSDAFGEAVAPAIAVIPTDTSVDTNSANQRVKRALSGAAVYVTDDFTAGALLVIGADGEMTVSDLTAK